MNEEAGRGRDGLHEAGLEKPSGELIGELLGLLAHDLRNPLAALHSNLGYLDTVLAGRDEEAREAVEDGIVSCDGLSHIIDNVDLLGQVLRDGLIAPRLSPSPISTIAAAVVERCQAAAKSHGSSLDLDPGSRMVHANVTTSRDLAIRALSNLVRNSIQHSPAGSHIRVSLKPSQEEVVVRVVDTGSSLAESEGAFSAKGQVQAKSAPGSRYSRGMGLYSAQLAATLCGARLSAQKGQSGAGNEFCLAFRCI